MTQPLSYGGRQGNWVDRNVAISGLAVSGYEREICITLRWHGFEVSILAQFPKG
jgi:hypothetical protein